MSDVTCHVLHANMSHVKCHVSHVTYVLFLFLTTPSPPTFPAAVAAAKGLLGKKVGDMVDIQVPNGTMQLEVTGISR